MAGKIALGVLLGLVPGAGLRALRIGGHRGDLLGLAGAVAAIGWHTGLTLEPMCTALEVAVHIAGEAGSPIRGCRRG